MGRIDEAQAAFLEIYQKDVWGIGDNIEPEPENIERYVALIQEFLGNNEIRSVVEFGCSAWPHLHRVNWDGIEYDGFDVVEALVDVATRRYEARNIQFHVMTDGARLPRADLLICKDVFQHLPCSDIKYYIGIFKSLYKYMLITDDIYPDDATNKDIEYGGYRAVRLDLEPFNERCAVLQRLEGKTFGIDWIKRTSLLLGSPEVGGAADYPLLGKGSDFYPGKAKTLRRRIMKGLKAIAPGAAGRDEPGK